MVSSPFPSRVERPGGRIAFRPVRHPIPSVGWCNGRRQERSRRSRVLPVQGRPGRVIYVGKGRSLRSRVTNYFQDPATSRPARRRWWRRPRPSSGSRSAARSRPSWYSLIKQHKPRFNIRLRDDKSYPFLAVTVEDEWLAHGHAGPQAQGRALLRAYGPRTPSAKPSTSCCARSRCAPARTTSSVAGTGPALPAVPHREVLGAVRGRGRPGAPTAPDAGPARLPRRRHRHDRPPPGAAHAGGGRGLEYEQAARLRDRLTAVRKAIEKQQMVADRSEDIDVIGVAEDDEAAVQVFYVRRGGWWAARGSWSTRSRTWPPASSSATCRGPLRRRPAGRPPAVLVPSEPDDPELYHPVAGPGRGGPVDIRVPQRGAKRERHLADGDPAPQPRSSPATACAGPATTTPGPRPSTSCRRPSACPRPAAHRVLRHGPHPGHRLRGLDGGHGGRAAAPSPSTGASRSSR